MKKFIILFIISLSILPNFSFADDKSILNSRYLFTTSNDMAAFYLDIPTVNFDHSFDEPTLSIWVKCLFTDKGKQAVEKNILILHPDEKDYIYEDWYALYHYLITKTKILKVSYAYYTNSGKLLDSYQYPHPQWEDIIPESITESISIHAFAVANN